MDTDQFTTISTAPHNDALWFEQTPEDTRSAFAHEHCSKVYNCDGQAVIVISYPRTTQEGFNVAAYDLDSGRISWIPLSLARVGSGGLFEAVYRDSEAADFEFSPILRSWLCDEATDIAARLFDIE